MSGSLDITQQEIAHAIRSHRHEHLIHSHRGKFVPSIESQRRDEKVIRHNSDTCVNKRDILEARFVDFLN